MPANSDRKTLMAAVRRDVPERPGVYTWLDASGAPLYVGKAVNLRARMLSYLSPGETAFGARQRRLAFSLHAFRFRETEGELLALLLEDALIKQLWPPYNERQKDYLERRYLLLTEDAFPTCLVVEPGSERPGTLYGPFKDRYLAAELLAIVTDDFGLRACPDPRPHRRSLRSGLGLCSGPCREAISPESYAEIAARVAAFLGGDEVWIAERLHGQVAGATEALEFERAADLQSRLDFCGRFAERQRFLGGFRGGEIEIIEPSSGLIYRFFRAALAAVTRRDGTRVPVPAEVAERPDDPREVLDRANVVYDWRRRAG